MATEVPAPAPKLDPETQRFQAAKASFEAALKKTAKDQGLQVEANKPADDAPVDAAPEAAPAPAKPKAPKVKAQKPVAAPKPVEAPKPDPLAAIHAQLAALTQKLEARQAPAPEPEVEEDDPLADVRAELTERLGDDAPSILKALEAIHAPSQKRIAQLEGVIREATRRGGLQVAKTNRQRLAESLPHLKTNDDAWAVIEERVASLARNEPTKYATIDDAYDGVANALYGDLQLTDDDAEAEEAEAEASRIAASGMTAPSKSSADRPMTKMQAAKAVFEHLRKNPEDKQGAKRLARELGSNQKLK